MIERIPVRLLTGFLGSGKTTLLSRMLLSSAFADTAVLINELGAVGLDHHLARGSSETMRLLGNGCVCCSVRDDLRSALADLYWDRLHRRIPRFRQVVIETTGLAEPAPLLQVLSGSDIVAERYRWAGVICTVDAAHAQRELASRAEPARQIAYADVIFVTKVDLATAADVQALQKRLRDINPVAVQFLVAHGEAPSEAWTALDAGTRRSLHVASGEPPMFMTRTGLPTTRVRGSRQLHAADVRTFTLEMPLLSVPALVESLQRLIARHAKALLRVKGVVRVTDASAPVVVQAVHEHLHPFTSLDMSQDTVLDPALVFIVSAESRSTVDAIEQDIRHELASPAQSK